jgi:membrane-bound serine protease (ClpP class)
MELSLGFAYFLIVVGLLLLVAEVFIPTGGVLFVLSVAALVVGVVVTFQRSQDLTTPMVTLIGICLAIPAILGLMVHVWPRTPMGKRFFLNSPEHDATIATMPVNVELEQLRGRFGRTVSALRPAGVTDFDGRQVDTMSEGMMIEPGQWVRCIDVRAGKVIVRVVDRPNLGGLESADFT